jgi:hypothetical protein
MMLLAMAALLQAAQPATPSQPAPAWRVAGQAWGACVKARIDARLTTSDAPEALTDAAIAGCTRELEAVRTAIAAERGAEIAAADVERVRSGGRATFIAYVAQHRAPASAPAH